MDVSAISRTSIGPPNSDTQASVPNAQRPSRSAELLPGRETERVTEHVAKCGRSQRRRNTARIVQLTVWCRRVAIPVRTRGRRRIQRKLGGAGEAAKQSWLRGPVQVPERAGKGVEVVLGAVVVT